jgi:hypothetical protein
VQAPVSSQQFKGMDITYSVSVFKNQAECKPVRPKPI